jgi:RNA polymerase sigma-70 factor (ECF subfamily)
VPYLWEEAGRTRPVDGGGEVVRVGAVRREAADPPPRLPSAAYQDWEALYADNVARVYRLMFAKVGNRPDAEDLTSQVFVASYPRLRVTAVVAQVRAYLAATARTVLAEHWRRTLGHQVTEIDPDRDDLADLGDVPAATGGAERAERDVARILDALPERQRQILTLRFLRGYTVRQAATELGVSVANAKVLQHRALRAAAGLDREEPTP